MAVPSCHDPIAKANDILLTYVSRSQFYELGKCVTFSSSFEHIARWNPWKKALYCSSLLGLIWRIFQVGSLFTGHRVLLGWHRTGSHHFKAGPILCSRCQNNWEQHGLRSC